MPRTWSASSLPLAAIAALEAAHAGTAIWQHRAPAVHDGFQYFTLQYFFLNNAIQAGDVAQWIPYMTQGTIATLWYGVQGSFLQSALLQAPWIVQRADLLTVFHIGMFVDQLILLAGTWLLARRFFSVPAATFVTMSIVGSAVWLDQPYWNFRLYYALPLVLELGHRFIDEGRWRWFLLAGNLLAVQTIGNLPYFIPFVSFVVCAYFLTYAAANPSSLRETLRRLRWGVPAIAALAFTALSFALAYHLLTIGISELVNVNPGRHPDARIDLDGFLTYGGHTHLSKWIDLVLNVSPWLDFTVYAGILIAPLAIAGVVTDRRGRHFALMAGILLLFTIGSILSVVAFHVWPGMQYFRHIGLVSPLVKVFLCFVAGAGFERLFVAGSDRPSMTRSLAIAGMVLLLAAAWLAGTLSRSPQATTAFVNRLSEPTIARPAHVDDPVALTRRLRSSATVAMGGAVIVGLVPIWLAGGAKSASPRLSRAIVIGVLACVAVDVYRFKFDVLRARSDVVFPAVAHVTHPAPMPFPARRDIEVSHAAATNRRVQATLAFNHALFQQLRGRDPKGTQYWSENMFLFVDEAGSSFRVDSWLKPLDHLMRIYWGDPIDAATPPRGLDAGRPGGLAFPLHHPAAATLAGISADKIRFFDRAWTVDSAQVLAAIVGDPSYAGGRLFLQSQNAQIDGAGPWTAEQSLAADDSRPLVYDIEAFDANNLVVRVTNPGASGVWMSYADVWHPFWHATVNSKKVPVHRANVAYKAVRLEPGENVVQFRFGSRRFAWLAMLFAANAAFWLCAVAWITARAAKHVSAR
jgi:hypothetical protein